MAELVNKGYSSLNIVAFTAYPWENVLPQLRLLNPAEALKINIIKGNNYQDGSITPELVKQGDLVFIQRDFPRYKESYQKIFELTKILNKPLIYEIDDLLFELTEFPTLEESNYYRPVIGSILHAVLNADAITTPTHPLKEKLNRYNSHTSLFANYLDDKKWDLGANNRRESDPFLISYIGTRSHIHDIEHLAPVIEYFYKKYKEKVLFQLRIERLPSRLMSYRNIRWAPISFPKYDDYIEWFSTLQADICIAPLLNTSFNGVKSPIKFLEYSSRGIPGVYSNTPTYQDVVNHGKNGFLASLPEEWIESIEALINKPDLRVELGSAASKTVKEDWLLSDHAGVWLNILQQVTSPPVRKDNFNPQIIKAFELLNDYYIQLENVIQKQENHIEQIETIRIGQEDLLLERAKIINELESGFINKQTFLKLKTIRQKLAPPGSRRVKLLKGALKFLRREPRTQPPLVIYPRHSQPVNYKVSHPIRLALYTTDNWSTASAHIRLVGPSNHPQSGIKILNGCQSSTYPKIDFFINADAVVIQRDFPRHKDCYHLIIDWAEKNHKPIIYEIDDGLFELPEDHPEKAYFSPHEDEIINAIKDSHAVITSTGPLARRIALLNPNTWVLPNYLDDQIWKLSDKPHQPAQEYPLSIGYMGGITQTHLPDIGLLKRVLNEILQEFEGKIELHFWGVIPPELIHKPNVVFHDQKYPDYRDFARNFSQRPINIVLAPLIQNSFNDYKSAIKFLEYSSQGSAGLYSEVTPYCDVIKPGKNGLLAKSEDDWFNNLRLLIQDHQLRITLGENALTTVRQLYLLSRHASEWERVYEAAITSS